ncbi:MAG: endonuclease/exonuclease/phosphatase family protein, partial [Clostridia bacterium]|nr:endonuclease/exonuclease/phosphatase family protein [Clostridia bacterium]
DIGSFRIRFENMSENSGERVLISEIRFCTEKEASELAEPDAYPSDVQDIDGSSLRILQFNVQTESGNMAPFSEKALLFRRLVDETVPDVAGMQEVTPEWRRWLDDYVFNDSYGSVGEPRSDGDEANPVYYRKDRFELVESGTFWLSGTPDRAGSYTEGANCPRICTWVLLKDIRNGTEFAYLTTHLDHNGKNDQDTATQIRRKQIGEIIKFAGRFEGIPVFLSGDLNFRSDSPGGSALYSLLTGKTSFTDTDGKEYAIELSDSRISAGITVDAGHSSTMVGGYGSGQSGGPIDYVFCSPSVEAVSYETFLITEKGIWISDHLPVFAVFRFPEQAG